MIDLDELERAYEASTQGEWYPRVEAGRVYDILCGHRTIVETDSGVYPPGIADANFIALAHNAFPALLAELAQEKARAERAEALHAAVLEQWVAEAATHKREEDALRVECDRNASEVMRLQGELSEARAEVAATRAKLERAGTFLYEVANTFPAHGDADTWIENARKGARLALAALDATEEK